MEESFIGTLLLYERNFEKIINYPVFFEKKEHIYIYNGLKELYQSGIRFSKESLMSKCNELRPEYISSLISKAFQPDLFQSKLNELLKIYVNRKIDKIQAKYRSGEYVTLEDYLRDLDGCNIAHLSAENSTKTLKEVYAKYNKKTQEERYQTGISRIDNWGGLLKTNLITIGARPGVGKTSLMAQLLVNDIQLKYGVGVFSLEMEDIDIIQKILSNIMEIDENDIDKKFYTRDNEIGISKLMDATKDHNFFINDNPHLDIDTICRTIRYWDKKYNLDKYYIDYVQFIPTIQNFRTETDRVDYIMKKLFKLKKDIKKNIIILAQLNREVEKTKEQRRPRLSDLKQSGQIEQSSDIVMFLHENMPINATTAEMEIIIAKGRKMPKGIVPATFKKNYSKFIITSEGYNE